MCSLRPLRFALTLSLLGATLLLPVHAVDMVPLDLRFARVNLANGRILENAALTGFNRESELIYVMEDRKLKPYPAALFPGFVRDEIDSRLAEYPDTSDRAAREEGLERDTAEEVNPQSTPQPIGSPEANAATRAAIAEAVSAKAERAALRHFRYSSRNGSGYSTMTNGEVELDEPAAIPGWPDRYRVEGIAYFSIYDSVGESFQNRRRGVEIIVEAKSPRNVKVLDVTTDWTPRQ